MTDYEEALAELDREFPSPLDDHRDPFLKELCGTLMPHQRIRKPTWRKCADGGKHNIIRIRTLSDAYDKCTKCGMIG